MPQDFILEVEVDATGDNDGMGLVFGWQSEANNLRAILMNDGSPNPAADGVGGPFMKIKRRNGKPCLGAMDASNNCFETLSYLTNDKADALRARPYNNPLWGPSNFNHPSGAYSWPRTLPPPFAQTYPYATDANFGLKALTLIVKDSEATLLFYKDGVPVATRAPSL